MIQARSFRAVSGTGQPGNCTAGRFCSPARRGNPVRSRRSRSCRRQVSCIPVRDHLLQLIPTVRCTAEPRRYVAARSKTAARRRENDGGSLPLSIFLVRWRIPTPPVPVPVAGIRQGNRS